MIISILFWISVFLIFFSYFFYPILIGVFSHNRTDNTKVFNSDKPLPYTSIIISAFNEESVIKEKLDSIYSGTLPESNFEVIIGSDASGDKTASIINNYKTTVSNLSFYDFKVRRGKQNVVNDLVAKSKGEILILTDANVMFDKQTIFELIKHFKNKKIGLVDSHMINTGLKKEGISFQEKAYISREVKIKNNEAKLWGAMMGPFGGCYAIRRKLYMEVPSNFLVDDFYINMCVLEQGYQAINNLEAHVFEEIPNKLSIEFKRKIRIGTGNFQNLKRFRKLIFSFPYGFAFFSHKVLRWIGPFLMIIALLSNIILCFINVKYCYLLFFHIGLYLLPLLDFILKLLNIHIHKVRLSTHFFAMNLALFIGFFKALTTIKTGVWERTQRK